MLEWNMQKFNVFVERHQKDGTVFIMMTKSQIAEKQNQFRNCYHFRSYKINNEELQLPGTKVSRSMREHREYLKAHRKKKVKSTVKLFSNMYTVVKLLIMMRGTFSFQVSVWHRFFQLFHPSYYTVCTSILFLKSCVVIYNRASLRSAKFPKWRQYKNSNDFWLYKITEVVHILPLNTFNLTPTSWCSLFYLP